MAERYRLGGVGWQGVCVKYKTKGVNSTFFWCVIYLESGDVMLSCRQGLEERGRCRGRVYSKGKEVVRGRGRREDAFSKGVKFMLSTTNTSMKLKGV